MKKKHIAFALVSVLLCPLSCFGQEGELSVYLDDALFSTEHPAVIRDDRVLLSLRDMGKLTDSDVTWRQERNTATLLNGKQKVLVTLGQATIYSGGSGRTEEIEMDTEPFVLNDRIYLPARFVSEAFDFEVSWKEKEQRIELRSPEKEAEEEPVRRAEEAQQKSTNITPTTTVHYSHADQNLEELIAYLKNNLDEAFDINDFQVTINDETHSASTGEILSTSIRINLKKGEFVTTEGYSVTAKNGIVTNIRINGEPKATSADSLPSEDAVDEELLKKKALAEITLYEGDRVESQEVFKRYDTEPYYLVKTIIHNIGNDFSRVKSYEYRR